MGGLSAMELKNEDVFDFPRLVLKETYLWSHLLKKKRVDEG